MLENKTIRKEIGLRAWPDNPDYVPGNRNKVKLCSGLDALRGTSWTGVNSFVASAMQSLETLDQFPGKGI